MPRVALSLLCALTLSSIASAQEQPTFVGASGILSLRSANPQCSQGSGCSLPDESGTAWGVGVEFRRLLTPIISVGIEASIPQAIATLQHTGFPNGQYDATHRDVSVSGVVGLQAPRMGLAQLVVVGGAGLLQERFSVSSTTAPFGSSTFPPFSAPLTTTRWAFALVGGADLDLAIAPHVSVAPELRVHWILSNEEGEGVTLGLGSIVWRPAVALRVHF